PRCVDAGPTAEHISPLKSISDLNGGTPLLLPLSICTTGVKVGGGGGGGLDVVPNTSMPAVSGLSAVPRENAIKIWPELSPFTVNSLITALFMAPAVAKISKFESTL